MPSQSAFIIENPSDCGMAYNKADYVLITSLDGGGSWSNGCSLKASSGLRAISGLNSEDIG